VASTCKIIALDEHTVDQMAAGEVVERPASVAKELVENALDAGAARIHVTLEQGGLGALIVSDNGSGMHADDAQRCILRHATSKIRAIDDLTHIQTMGFRGEALSSIASVSRLTLTTREPHTDVGTRLVIEGGVVTSVTAAGSPVGTTLAVRDLFYNVPARRKFMRSPATEQAHVYDAMVRVMLAARRGGLVVQTQGRTLLDVPEGANATDRAQLALGRGVDHGVSIDLETEGVLVTGVLTAGALARGETRRLWIFVNGRFVRDRSLQRAITTACAPGMGVDQPAALIYIDLPPDQVDVNVHPQKLEVRFFDASMVHRAVTQALQQAAGAYQRARLAEVQDSSPPAWPQATPKASQRAFRGATGSVWRMPSPQATGPSWQNQPQAQLSPQPEHLLLPKTAHLPGIAVPADKPATSVWHRAVPLGVAPQGYLCCQEGCDLIVVDLIVAEQAVLSHALSRHEGPMAPHAQLMPPTWIPDDGIQPAVDDYLIETAQSPSPWGVVLEAVGPGHYVVMAVPEPLCALPPVAVAEGLMSALAHVAQGCHQAYVKDRAQVVQLWLQHVLAAWQGPASGSAAVWGPRWLARLAEAEVSPHAPVMYRLAASAVPKMLK
jgi:DNA mismatch repair protein MutL